MRTLSIILICGFFFLGTCVVSRRDENAAVQKNTHSLSEKAINFDKQMLPLMKKNCSPCHFAGGKMYDRLPFDKDTTIINHGERILSRFKNDDEKSLLEAFHVQNKNGLSPDKPH